MRWALEPQQMKTELKAARAGREFYSDEYDVSVMRLCLRLLELSTFVEFCLHCFLGALVFEEHFAAWGRI